MSVVGAAAARVRQEVMEPLQHQLEELATKEPARVVKLARAPGEREARWAHLLCGEVLGPATAGAQVQAGVSAGELSSLMAEQTRMSAELDELKTLVQRIARELGIDPTH